jgi:protein-tyrosine phosphatase
LPSGDIMANMDRHLRFDRLHNFRDLGGYRGAGGREVRWGRLYRADSLGKLDGADWDRFAALGVRTVVDLRHPSEVARRGRVRECDGIAFRNVSIEHRPYDQAGLGADIEVTPYLTGRYLELAHDGKAELREAIELLADSDGPAVFHCMAGKDRTGIVAALILTLLGVGEPDIVADFALSGLAADRFTADWHTRNPGGGHLWPGYCQAPPELMTAFLAGLASRYGSAAEYAERAAGIGPSTVASLRDRLLG